MPGRCGEGGGEDEVKLRANGTYITNQHIWSHKSFKIMTWIKMGTAFKQPIAVSNDDKPESLLLFDLIWQFYVFNKTVIWFKSGEIKTKKGRIRNKVA